MAAPANCKARPVEDDSGQELLAWSQKVSTDSAVVPCFRVRPKQVWFVLVNPD